MRMGMRVARDSVPAGGVSVLRSPVSWALLGLVIERPSYGYELVQRFERTYGDALALSSASQIYTALDSLESRELVHELMDDPDPNSVVRQPKPHYRATASGVRAYQGWLIAQAGEERRRSRLFARQLAVLAPAAALQVIERYELACLEQARGPFTSAPEGVSLDGTGGLAQRLASEEDRLAVGSRLSWIEYARREFKALAGGRSPQR